MRGCPTPHPGYRCARVSRPRTRLTSSSRFAAHDPSASRQTRLPCPTDIRLETTAGAVVARVRGGTPSHSGQTRFRVRGGDTLAQQGPFSLQSPVCTRSLPLGSPVGCPSSGPASRPSHGLGSGLRSPVSGLRSTVHSPQSTVSHSGTCRSFYIGIMTGIGCLRWRRYTRK